MASLSFAADAVVECAARVILRPAEPRMVRCSTWGSCSAGVVEVVLGTHDDAVNRLVGDLSGVVPFISRALEGAFTGRKPTITLPTAVDPSKESGWRRAPDQ